MASSTSNQSSSFSSCSIFARRPVLIGLLVRLFAAWFLPWLLDNEDFIPGVAYTDIDFHVFSDAAAHIRSAGSPYDRTTYRYTPFLAALLAAFPDREWGRFTFCVADALCGWIILLLRRQNRKRAKYQYPPNGEAGRISPELQDALWWLYNPVAINICTRGSAESFVVLLPVLITVWILTSSGHKEQPSTFAAVAAGLAHGVAIHAKLYPIMYTLSFMTALAPKSLYKRQSTADKPSVTSILFLWIRRLLTPAPVLFGIVSVATFVGLTFAAVRAYGDAALQEGLLYHFSRVDHRHNYSMHWYWIYLARARVGGAASMAVAGRLLLAPQLVLLVYTSLGVAPQNLSLALFVQTFLFVAHNKVITAQYFTWYLCLLPLCSDQLRLTRRMVVALAVLIGSILLWLGSAYCLEMQGMSVHRIVWMASVVFFLANVNFLGAWLASTSSSVQIAEQKKKKD